MRISVLLLSLLSVVSAIPVENTVEGFPSTTDSTDNVKVLNSFRATEENVKILGRANTLII